MKKLKKTTSEVPPEYGDKVFERETPSDLSLKNPLLEDVMSVLDDTGLLDEEDQVWSRLCIDEILVNAFRHGNKEDQSKKVLVRIFTAKKLWAVRVEDEGEGFELADLPDLNSEEYYEREHGRGIMLMESYLDEIWYYDKGNRVQVMKIKRNKLSRGLDKIIQTIAGFFGRSGLGT